MPANKWISYKNIPNALSLFRMLLVLPFLVTVHDIFVYHCGKNWILLLVFFAIIVSDLADGYLARKLKCASNAGAKLDVLSDTVYTISSLTIFAYFNVTPMWFIFIMALKLLEFAITSRILKHKQKSGGMLFFDKIGKISVSIVMLLPGVFAFRCIIMDYKMVMNVAIYVITTMLALSFINRIMSAIKYLRA
jgi:CDP-diacylglycerol--glycerol-3-phosphate 3-phosphatidyltransferase